MPPAYPRTPHAAVTLPAHPEEVQNALLAIPGVKLARGAYLVPAHALALFQGVLQSFSLSFRTARWAVPTPPPTSWEAVLEKLRAGGEAREEFLEGFLMPYQKEALVFAAPLDGAHFWHPTGCLTGDTLIGVNRAGKSFTLTLADLAQRFEEKAGRWDAGIETYAQCSIDGFVRLNRIVRAFSTGRKEVFLVRTKQGLQIRATKDHKFSTPEGFVPLGELQPGASVHVRSDTQTTPLMQVGTDEIVSIESAGIEETFDMTMESPHNNYVANGFVVHNSGKTLSAILWALLAPGTVIVITRAAARFQYAREWERFTTCRPYILRPASTLKKNAETLEQYMERPLSRHVIVAAWESLMTSGRRLISLRPTSIIWDEVHMGKASKRWESIPLSELPDDPDLAAKAARDQIDEARSRGGFVSDKDGERLMILPLDNMATASALLARASKRRVATTATPVKDRVRDLWAQLDLVEPDAWGSASVWHNRYCDRKPGLYGGFDTTGTSNLPELAERLKFVAHRIEYAATHRQLPAKRRQSSYIGAEDQSPPSGGFASELAAAHKRGATAVLEVKLAESASRKRRAVLGLVGDHVYNGGKIVIFTGRRRDVDALGDLLRKHDAVKAKNCTVWAAHGDHSSEERAEIVQEYMRHPGPCVLVGTGDSFGESLNMQDTDAALFVQLPYTPGQIRQWEGRFCVAAGQHIITRDRGSIPIEDVVAGDFVMTHKGRWRKVKKTHEKFARKRDGSGPEIMVDMTFMSGPRPLRTTADHRVLVIRDEISPAWMRADDVRVGDRLLVPRGACDGEVSPVLKFPDRFRVGALFNRQTEELVERANGRYIPAPERVHVDKETAWVFGLFLGDGWTRVGEGEGRFVGIAGDSRKKEDLDRAAAVFARWGYTATIRTDSRGLGMSLRVYSGDLANWFRFLFGADSHSKCVPGFVFTWSRDLVHAFVEGYFAADGTKRDARNRRQWSTVSTHLAYQLPLLLARIGRVASTREKEVPYPWRLLPPERQDEAKSYLPSKVWAGSMVDIEQSGKVEEDYVLRQITEIRSYYAPRGDKVYDLEVEEDESFLAEGVVVHNCRLGQKRPVTIYYVIAEGTIDEHVADILIRKLPAVEKVAQDAELAAARDVISGADSLGDKETFARRILDKISTTVSDDTEVCDDDESEDD